MTSRWVLTGSVTCTLVAAWRTEICEDRRNGRHLRSVDIVDSVQARVFALTDAVGTTCNFPSSCRDACSRSSVQ